MGKIRGFIVLIQFSITVAITIALMYTFRNHTHKVIKVWMKFQMKFLGIKLEEHGTLDESCDMVIMNHQSLLDIIVMEYIHSRDLAWVAKKEITDMPFFGHIIKAPRMISVDRENKVGIVKLIKDVKDRLDKKDLSQFFQRVQGEMEKLYYLLNQVQKWLQIDLN